MSTLFPRLAGMIALASLAHAQTLDEMEKIPPNQRYEYFKTLPPEVKKAINDEQSVRGRAMQRASAPTGDQIEQWRKERDLESLWDAYHEAMIKQYDSESGRVFEQVVQALAQIPERFQYLGDRIKQGLDEKDYMKAELAVNRLISHGGIEAAQQFGRYLREERRLGKWEEAYHGPDYASPASPKTWETAAGCIYGILREHCPVDFAAISRGERRPEEVLAEVRDWWFSEEARKFREWKPGQPSPLAPVSAVTTADASAATTPESTIVATTAPAHRVEPPSWALLIGALAALVGGTGFLLWLGLRKRGGGVR